MAQYVDYGFYTSLYGEILAADFCRFAWEAGRVMDNHTTGADGFRKLKYAFPVDVDDAEAVKLCAAKLVNILLQIGETEKAALQTNGYTQTENGLKGRVIASVSSGTESVSYATGSRSSTVFDKAVLDPAEKHRLLSETVRECLSGVRDANGVNLLYMGVYPYVR